MRKTSARRKTVLAWSGGKDSALALYELQKDKTVEVVGLLTTITKDYDRVSMHGLRRALLEQQAEALGLPVEIVSISKAASNKEYDNSMRRVNERYKTAGIKALAFGDLFLEDIRKYREKNLAEVGLTGLFPLWKKDTVELASRFIELGFKAVTTCVDSQALGREFVGREFDAGFLRDLPPGIDPCGEKGEFHTFVHEGPVLSKKIRFKKGDIVLRENRFWYCDLLPV